jgi:hypothetical protein
LITLEGVPVFNLEILNALFGYKSNKQASNPQIKVCLRFASRGKAAGIELIRRNGGNFKFWLKLAVQFEAEMLCKYQIINVEAQHRDI